MMIRSKRFEDLNAKIEGFVNSYGFQIASKLYKFSEERTEREIGIKGQKMISRGVYCCKGLFKVCPFKLRFTWNVRNKQYQVVEVLWEHSHVIKIPDIDLNKKCVIDKFIGPKNSRDLVHLLETLVETACLTSKKGLNKGTSGNLSAKFRITYKNPDNEFITTTLIAITPTGISYEELSIGDISLLFLHGKKFDMDIWCVTGKYPMGMLLSSKNRKLPSSEYPFHCAIYQKFEDAHTIVHTHAKHSTLLACTEEFKGLPPFHYMICVTGSSFIPLASYQTYGTEELSESICTTLWQTQSKVCFMENHGVVSFGKQFKESIKIMETVETLSELYLGILSAGLKPKLLKNEELADVFAKIGSYGKQVI